MKTKGTFSQGASKCSHFTVASTLRVKARKTSSRIVCSCLYDNKCDTFLCTGKCVDAGADTN